MDYNAIYKKNDNAFGDNPTPIINMAADIYLCTEKGGRFLDIGSGQGRNSFFMASLGFRVQAIDVSREACEQLSKKVKENHIQNIEVENTDIRDFVIDNNEFNIISVINVLHFIDKEAALAVINKIKKALADDGLIAISLFIVKNGFHKQELLKIFEDFDVLYYFESIINDKHPGQPEEHTHYISRILARKRLIAVVVS
jgi:tellurite methyltransferase